MGREGVSMENKIDSIHFQHFNPMAIYPFEKYCVHFLRGREGVLSKCMFCTLN